MFRCNICGENVKVTEAVHDYAEKKVGKLEHYFSDAPDATAHASLKAYTEETAEVKVTTPLPYLVLHAEETSSDLYAGIDLVADKLERQIRKFKTKINRKSRETGMNAADATTLFNEEDESENDSELGIVRMKHLSLKPVDSEEAVLQMDVLGHNFFIFEDAEANGTGIVYHHKDEEYGLIETD